MCIVTQTNQKPIFDHTYFWPIREQYLIFCILMPPGLMIFAKYLHVSVLWVDFNLEEEFNYLQSSQLFPSVAEKL